ncbi:hypothetical protein GGR50DRAFT_74030 [Xylaria sp. CBS 124048]|nr:hypothetical protein GGR50DRAFT_74030 [Xylaria sp. CBS 124048]
MATGPSSADLPADGESAPVVPKPIGVFPVSWWTWQGQALEPPMDYRLQWETPQDQERLLACVFNRLRISTSNFVRETIESSSEIKRSLDLRTNVRQNGRIAPICLELSRPEVAAAVAAHLMLPTVNVRSCARCEGKGNALFESCRTFGANVFNGACSCCQGASRAAKCTFHKSQKGNRYATLSDEALAEAEAQDEAKAAAQKLPNVTPENVQLATRDALLGFAEIIAAELRRRDEMIQDMGAKTGGGESA